MNRNFKYISTTLVLLVVLPGFLLAADKAPANTAWSWVLQNLVLLVGGFTVLGIFGALWNLMGAVMVSKEKEFLRAHGIEPQSVATQPEETLLSRWYKKAWNLVPIEKEADIQLDHDYDGIKELDNSLPPWWLYGFYVSILVAIGYMYVYHFSDLGLSQQEEYAVEMKIGERQKLEYAAGQANNIDEANLLALTDEESLSAGSVLFKTNCAACHGAEGQGGVGPNLTDEYWIHGGSTALIYKTIKYGVPEKGMIAWKAQMQPASIHKIASYVRTLAGTSPPNPKEPQGDRYEEEEDSAIGMNGDK